ncbi:DUF2207 domain-containing protein [Bhargavaea cecembensis]|uniref:DUF2207 domain-containing protein n=1 Tax=Bhargavaea cecembensis TaxID=394098 RepID=UPI0006944F4D|nr:DUF2207 domain-containing protein [Bhargavaea cecembensis]
MRRWTVFLSAVAAVFLVLLLPNPALAADYEITESVIDAQAGEDGLVNVKEFHTYSFSGKFNGITRELHPMAGTKILDVAGFEDGRPLKTERDGNLYKVHRSGKNETVTVELHYTIADALSKHEDGVEFIWPFFDDRNESDYEKMTIFVRPPSPSSNTEALGYDALYRSEKVEPDGTARFGPVRVKSEKNGDVRVVFDAALFPGLAASGGTVRDGLAADRTRLAEEAAAAERRHETAIKAGNIVLPIAGAPLLFVFIREWLIAKRKKEEARREAALDRLEVPQTALSMPAVLQFTSTGGVPQAEWLSASLLDLIRKGLVVQLSDELFERTDRLAGEDHEQILLDLFFRVLANPEGRLDLSRLGELTQSEQQADSYEAKMAEWAALVDVEVKTAGLKEKRPLTRTILSSVGVMLVGLAIYFGIAEAFVHVLIAGLLAFILFVTAALLKPLTPEGHLIRAGWNAFSEQFGKLDPEEWRTLPQDDRLRGYIYAVGMKDKHLGTQFSEFSSLERRTPSGTAAVYADPFVMTHAFSIAGSNVAQHSTSASSSGTSAGGGAGGGGGGSGAF